MMDVEAAPAVPPARPAADAAADGSSSPPPDWVLTNYDPATTLPPDAEAELQRLLVLRSFPLLRRTLRAGAADDAAADDPDCATLAELAASLLAAPMACVKLVDLARIRVAAAAGAWPGRLRELPRRDSFCAHTVQARGRALVVPDASQDPRFRHVARVAGPPFVRFYAGAPLVTREGARIGSVCVFDTAPRPQGLTEAEVDHLVEIARLVMDMLEQSRAEEQAQQQVGATAATTTVHGKPRASSMSHCSASPPPPAVPPRLLRGSMGNLTYHKAAAAARQPVTVTSLVQGLRIAMESFPKQVPLEFHIHPDCPLVFCVPNDLFVFRSAVAVLTSACERTREGFVRMTLQAGPEGHLLLACEDTAPDLDPSVDLFAPREDDAPRGDAAAAVAVGADCLRVDPATGEVVRGAVCRPPSAPPASGNGPSLHAVAAYMRERGGRYGMEPRNAPDGTTGSIVWFSFPLDDTAITTENFS